MLTRPDVINSVNRALGPIIYEGFEGMEDLMPEPPQPQQPTAAEVRKRPRAAADLDAEGLSDGKEGSAPPPSSRARSAQAAERGSSAEPDGDAGAREYGHGIFRMDPPGVDEKGRCYFLFEDVDHLGIRIWRETPPDLKAAAPMSLDDQAQAWGQWETVATCYDEVKEFVQSIRAQYPRGLPKGLAPFVKQIETEVIPHVEERIEAEERRVRLAKSLREDELELARQAMQEEEAGPGCVPPPCCSGAAPRSSSERSAPCERGRARRSRRAVKTNPKYTLDDYDAAMDRAIRVASVRLPPSGTPLPRLCDQPLLTRFVPLPIHS